MNLIYWRNFLRLIWHRYFWIISAQISLYDNLVEENRRENSFLKAPVESYGDSDANLQYVHK